jgi:hypothetical protein
MRIIAKLFGKSPFAPLQAHMEKVKESCEVVNEITRILVEDDKSRLDELIQAVSLKEHEADEVKNDIRLHLPKTTFLPVSRADILDILSIQDAIADTAEDVGVLLSMKRIHIPKELVEDFEAFQIKVRATFDRAFDVIKELNELFEVTFGGPEAKKVERMIDEVCYLEHEADIAQNALVRHLLAMEDRFTPGELLIAMKIFEKFGNIANYAEKLANRIRTLLLVD